MGKNYGKECKGGEECNDVSHLCKVPGRKDFTCIRELVRDARYFCGKCGRSARNESNLCKPIEI